MGDPGPRKSNALFRRHLGGEPQAGPSGGWIGWDEAHAKGREPEELRGSGPAPPTHLCDLIASLEGKEPELAAVNKAIFRAGARTGVSVPRPRRTTSTKVWSQKEGKRRRTPEFWMLPCGWLSPRPFFPLGGAALPQSLPYLRRAGTFAHTLQRLGRTRRHKGKEGRASGEEGKQRSCLWGWLEPLIQAQRGWRSGSFSQPLSSPCSRFLSPLPQQAWRGVWKEDTLSLASAHFICFCSA